MPTTAGGAPVPHPEDIILLVDDDPLQHALINGYLKDRQVRHAHTPGEALAILQQQDIEVVLLDFYLPEMDGLAMLRRIKKANGIAQVIVITASEEMEDIIRALEAGANDFLLKPLDKKALDDALENALSRIDRWKATLMELFQRKKAEAGKGEARKRPTMTGT
jgi:DNA-binding response OmpR family regulator